MVAKTVLVVEDDKQVQDLLRDALEREGFHVTCEKDGEWARKSLERRLPDLVITDVLLPTLNGFELIASLRDMPGGEHVDVIVISGIYRGARHKQRAKERYNAVGYLEKPFKPSELVELLRRHLADDYPGARRKKPSARGVISAPTPDPLADPGTEQERDEVERAAVPADTKKNRGNLKQTRFPVVLSELYRQKASGALFLRRDRVKKIIYLQDGYPTFVKSNLLSECLGRVLVRERLITEDECEVSLTKMKERGRQQGTVLIEMGCISPHNLVYGLQLQLETKLFEVFAWPEGEYQFSPAVDVPANSVQLDMSLATIIYEGVRRQFSDEEAADLTAPYSARFLGVHDDPLHRFQEIALEADERRLVGLIDGTRSTAEVVKASGLPEDEANKLVYALIAAEMVQARQSAAKSDLMDFPARTMEVPRPVSAVEARTRPPPLKDARKKKGGPPPIPKRDQPPALPSRRDPNVEALRSKLTERARTMERQNYFEMLGISRRADAEEVRRAYFADVQELHPDKLRKSAPADARALASQIQAELASAYEVLSDPERREAYEAQLEAGDAPAALDGAGRILKAEAAFEQGQAALEAGDLEDAATKLQESTELYPEAGEFHAWLGWARFLTASDDSDREEALAEIRRAIELSPRVPDAYVMLGRVYQKTGRASKAHEWFERAIQVDPDCTEALEALELIGRAPAGRS
jgi:DNA-binding response OmpR family regulator/tetratricopeptide (TPR) repeat protein